MMTTIWWFANEFKILEVKSYISKVGSILFILVLTLAAIIKISLIGKPPNNF